MDADDLVLFAVDFIDNYTHECLEDLILMFKRARNGVFGEIYNRIDGPTINRWFREHLEQKYTIREQIIEAKKNTHENPLMLLGPERIKELRKTYQHQKMKPHVIVGNIILSASNINCHQ